jgi:hypothetical protein
MGIVLRERWLEWIGLGLAVFIIAAVSVGETEASQVDDEALALGHRVIAVQRALKDPGRPGALAAIVDLGTDSRHYVMVRGWLMLQLQADTSIIEATREPDRRPNIESRIEFVRTAIRAIDLE